MSDSYVTKGYVLTFWLQNLFTSLTKVQGKCKYKICKAENQKDKFCRPIYRPTPTKGLTVDEEAGAVYDEGGITLDNGLIDDATATVEV